MAVPRVMIQTVISARRIDVAGLSARMLEHNATIQ